MGHRSHSGLQRIVLLGVAALLVYFVAAWNSVGYHHADEHFQILEFAHFKRDVPGLTPADLAWEYEARIRPGAQVLVAWCVMELAFFFSIDDPFHVAAILRFLSAILFLITIGCIHMAARPLFTSERARHIHLAAAIVLWFLPYLAVRPSSENWSACTFFIAIACMIGGGREQHWKGFGIGLLFGISFCFRYQMGIAIAGVLLWMILQRRRPPPVPLIAGVAIAIAAGTLADRWLYGEWTFSPWNYLRVNILEGKASEFGVDPWYYYFVTAIEKAGPVIGLMVIAAMLHFWWRYRAHVLTWATLPFLVIHLFISHKELRFLFPLAPLLPLAIALFMESGIAPFMRRSWFIVLLLLFDLPPLLYVISRPAAPHVKALEEARRLPQGSLLFFTHIDPYHDTGLPHRFYRRDDHPPMERLERCEDLKYLMSEEALVWTEDIHLHRHEALGSMRTTALYRTYPLWVTDHFNFNDWVSRTGMRALYKVEKR